ncbi:protein FAR1-RELATED SEQUENCE 5-like [Apium graveolens]|uniref:protein FAR1-RELATED SEQUENCE 5-like n=1 Tax=Apium graveolens TaxID=4045 RepID=UPI003D7B4A63
MACMVEEHEKSRKETNTYKLAGEKMKASISQKCLSKGDDSECVSNENPENVMGDFAEDWIPECDDSKKLVLDQLFADRESAFKFYFDYGKITEDENIARRRRTTVSAKCECPAKLVIGSSAEGDGYVVKKFVEKHNHAFRGKGAMQFLRCSRSLTEFHKKFILDAAKLNIGPTRAYAIFKSMIGSYEDVGATVIDFKNFSRDIKHYIGKHDADLIIQNFKDIQASSDTEFKFEYKTDKKNHLTQMFWADGIGRRNFDVFGDVVSFDATYSTNNYCYVLHFF